MMCVGDGAVERAPLAVMLSPQWNVVGETSRRAVGRLYQTTCFASGVLTFPLVSRTVRLIEWGPSESAAMVCVGVVTMTGAPPSMRHV